MRAVIKGMGCVTPPGMIDQKQMAELSRRYNATTKAERALIDRVYRGTRVNRRASALGGDMPTATANSLRSSRSLQTTAANHPADHHAKSNLNGTAHDPTSDQAFASVFDFYPQSPGPQIGDGPSTRDRLIQYELLALPLAAAACHQAMQDAAIDPATVTQIVSVSCTGFAAPGLEVRLIRELGLPANVGRTSVGFMGCHGAVNGLRVAQAFAAADPDATVLLVCTELCTLHFQYGHDPQLAVANALFGDGAAAMVIQPATSGEQQHIQIADCTSTVLPDTEQYMSWRIGDAGFVMSLSAEVPGLIEQHARPFVEQWLAGHDLSIDAVGGWVLHPGGPKVIAAVEAGLGLPSGAGDHARGVLRDFGNMSSPTVLFIAQRMKELDITRPWVMLAFGPGLVIEAALLQ